MYATALGDGSTEELRLLRRYMWDRIENPLPAISRTGNIVTGADGKPVSRTLRPSQRLRRSS
jgi:hypothetical protein